ncbi:MAG: SOS response-associated peptidase [Pseudomonas sp.]|uniref:SOS response-associated peptidase n=1 Tax=Pseudomonas sp. TaxID=306 RepID=UPI0012027119|nr:SOS response-associated peptidase [Pseudomonas sp.]RZI76712.1 MAG: SOS response-associated peptidase [Pseudomonas sp.]
MCNDYRLEVEIASILKDFSDLKIKIDLSEGTPNVAAREDIKITDVAPIVRIAAGERRTGEMVNRRWSWPGPKGSPVYNFRSEGRRFGNERCLILADGFYEFTKPADSKQKRQDKWLFRMRDHSWFCIAGIWKTHPEVGEAFTMLTMPPGPDVAPYHDRQIVPLPRDSWADWLNPAIPAEEVLRHLPKGSLPVTRVFPSSDAAPAEM